MVLTPTPSIAPVVDDLRSRGYDVTRLDGATTPPAVAAGGSAPDAVTDRPLSVEPVAARATPLSVVARLADAARDERATLFVVDPETADAVVDVLSDPFLRPGDDARGAGGFYPVDDRVRLADGTLAAVAATGEFGWHEDGSSDPSLVLAVGGDARGALRSVDALTCPGPDPDAFPYRYAREEDRRFHLYDRDREVGTYTGVTAMRTGGFRPVPLPLVPEHHLRENAGLARHWTVATVEDGAVRYVTSRTDR